MEKYELQKQVAENLLLPLFKCIDKDYKSSNFREIWGQYENFVKSAAASKNLSQFYGKFKRLCPFDGQKQHTEKILQYLASCNEREVLQILRGDELAVTILITQSINQQ